MAHDQQATLLIAFIGHGATTAAEDFHLLAYDSPATPDAESAFHLAQGIRDRLNRSPGLDGLIVLVDACQTGQGLAGAARRWTDVLNAGGRMELLVAAGDGNVYAGCFTRTLLAALSQGLSQAGENLLCTNLVPGLTKACPRQLPQHLSFAAGAGASDSDQGDAGLFLVPNVARRADAVSGLAAAGLVDQLTRGLVVTTALTETLTELAEADDARLRLLVGPAGCGKSTLVSLLIRPGLTDTLDADPRYVDAAVFLDTASSVATMTEDLMARLDRGLPGFAAAREQIAAERAALQDETGEPEQDVVELDLASPLERCRKPGRRVRLLVDGLDQPERVARETILTALSGLTRSDRLHHVRVIATARTDVGVDGRPELAHAYRLELQLPDPADLVRALAASTSMMRAPRDVIATEPVGHLHDGGWLLARLLGELDRSDATPGSFKELIEVRLGQAFGAGSSPEATRTSMPYEWLRRRAAGRTCWPA